MKRLPMTKAAFFFAHQAACAAMVIVCVTNPWKFKT